MEPGSDGWLDQVSEDVIDPDQPIIDPHHHLWPPGGSLPYGIDELHGDTDDGHNVTSTVFVECHAAYDRDASEAFRPVGETRFVADAAAAASHRAGAAQIRGIVGHADLTSPELDAVLDAHTDAGRGLFRGIRHAIARDDEPDALRIPGRARAGLSTEPAFRAGLNRLGERGLTFDSWHYHHQNAEFAELAAAAPDTTIVLDHFGTPIGVGRFAGRGDDVFDDWRRQVDLVAAQPNVVVKLGGLAMPDNGFGWDHRDRPASSDEIVAAHGRYYHHAIEVFGPQRCMLESNFPVDRFSVSYRVLWNALKKLVADFDHEDQQRMFVGTATEVYSL
ncbi:MAG: amidohydrolase family protein [Actinomycetota bacterium]